MEKICKHCKHSEIYMTHRCGHEDLTKYKHRKCNLLYNYKHGENIEPRLDNEWGSTGVTHIDVADNFGCILFEKRV